MSTHSTLLDRGQACTAARCKLLVSMPRQRYGKLGPISWHRDWLRLDTAVGQLRLLQARYASYGWMPGFESSVDRLPVVLALHWRLDGGEVMHGDAGGSPQAADRTSSAARARLLLRTFVVACLASAGLVACGTDAAVRQPPVAAPPVAPVAPGVPEEVRAALLQLAGRAPSDPVIAWKDIGRTAGGRPVMQAQGAGVLCEEVNCPFGLFVERQGAFHPILLTMASEAPFLSPDAAAEAPRASVLSAASVGQWRLTHYRWDGDGYAQVSCSLVDRTINASRACGATLPAEAELDNDAPSHLCKPVRRLAAQAGAGQPSSGTTFLPHAFVVRDDTDGYVEAVKLAGRFGPAALRSLTLCLRAARTGPRVTAAILQGRDPTPPTWRWTLRDTPGLSARHTMAMSATYLACSRMTVVAFGLFDQKPQARRDASGLSASVEVR